MNANRHRIVFRTAVADLSAYSSGDDLHGYNRARGLFMAVAEIACAQGKSPANGSGATTIAPPGFSLARLRPTAFAALLACGAQLALLPAAHAQVVAYKAAPAS
ncbi:MAG: ESPR-type extended signal peptide-containing protein, partial [Rhodocyclaceae bacterium]